MARTIPAPSATAGPQLVTGAGTPVGVSCRESAGTPAAASFVLRDGTDNTGRPLTFVHLAQSESQTFQVPAVTFTTRLYLDRTGGQTEAVAYLL